MPPLPRSELEMASKSRYQGQLDEEAPLDGPLASPEWAPESVRSLLTRQSRKGLVLGVLACLGALAFFALGAAVGPGSVAALAACGEGGGAGALGDTVAPEGPVSSDFDALFDYRGRPRSLRTATGAVAADHGRCSEEGAAVLREGGSAVDAAVAAALCQGVHNPMASGVGGGHIAVIRLPDGSAEVVDARETAPAAAQRDMFVGRPRASLDGGLAVAVPLELRGLHLAHARHGKLPWARLVRPAAEAAAAGFPAHPYLVSALQAANFTGPDRAALREAFWVREGGGWRPPRVNETCCRRPALAALLADVAEEGPDVLYRGKYSRGFAADIQAAGGIVTAGDLAAARASLREPLRVRVMGVEVVGPPPPSSAAAVMSALLVLSGWDLPLAGAGAVGVHRTVEALKHAFALRASMGDPGPDPEGAPLVPHLAELLADALSPEFAAQLRAAVRDGSVLNVTEYGGRWNVGAGGALPEDHGTSHVSAVDGDRMAVSLTTTINTGFGSRVVSPSTGILLNNQMDDFSTPGQPNVYGIPPSPSNFIAPGKKPFSSMSPLVVEREGALRAVLGASGGPRIISAVLQTLLRVLAYGEDAFSAVAGPRLHHQLLPEALYAEAWAAGGAQFLYGNDTLEALARRGHAVVPSAWGAVVQAVVVDPDEGRAGQGVGEAAAAGGLRAVSDPRKDGAPAGY